MFSHTVRWQKALFNVALVLIGMLSLVSVAAGEPAASLAGRWHGAIEIPGQNLSIDLQFEQAEAGGWTGFGDIPAQGAFGLALGSITVVGEQVEFAYVDVPADFQGVISSDGNRIEGVFHQAGMAFPFYVEREVENGIADDTLAEIRSYIEATMDAWQVPGVAVAIVKDGQVIMAEGFGMRDVENQWPVTAETQFGIGSSTKAFTTTVFQMLVEENVLQWDRPIREMIPGFRLQDPWASEHITPRDFALHRSGLPRHDLSWILNLNLDVDRYIAMAEHLTPAAGFRTGWIYNNFGYVVLGRLIEQGTQQPWEVAVAERILQPLGMAATNFSIEAMQESGDFSQTYAIIDGEVEAIPLRGVGAVGPAGGINSNARDMAKWLLFQLNKGSVGGQQLISAAGVAEMQSPHIAMGELVQTQSEVMFSSYGLGWMIDSYRGHYRVHHGGNTIGFSADVVLLPHDGIGVAVLTNLHGTPLPSLIASHVLDTLLELDPIDWSGQYKQLYAAQDQAMEMSQAETGRKAGTHPSHELQEYVGTYEHPVYGQVEIRLEGGNLTATYYDAEIVLEHWHFNQFRGRLDEVIGIEVPFFFQIDATGEIASVNIGFEPMVAPIPFTRQADTQWFDPTYLNQFAGDYDLLGQVIDISMRSGALVMTIPGQSPYRLAPIREGYFAFADFEGYGVEFVFSEEGQVSKAVLIQPQGNVELLRK